MNDSFILFFTSINTSLIHPSVLLIFPHFFLPSCLPASLPPSLPSFLPSFLSPFLSPFHRFIYPSVLTISPAIFLFRHHPTVGFGARGLPTSFGLHAEQPLSRFETIFFSLCTRYDFAGERGFGRLSVAGKGGDGGVHEGQRAGRRRCVH